MHEATVFVLTNNCIVSATPARSDHLTVYPNPVRADLHFSAEVKEASLFNVQGQVLRRSESTSQMSTEDLPSGVYFLEIRDGNQVFRKKIVKE